METLGLFGEIRVVLSTVARFNSLSPSTFALPFGCPLRQFDFSKPSPAALRKLNPYHGPAMVNAPRASNRKPARATPA